MKKWILSLTAALTFLGFSTSAQAGFLIEPYLGMAVSGDFTIGANSADQSGTQLGARLGLSTLGFIYGIDYMTGSFTVDGTPDTDYDATNLGVFVGYEFPILIRAYFSYFFDATAEGDGTEYTGSGTRIGVQWTGLPFVALGVEMYQVNYDERTVGGTTTEVDYDSEMTFVTLSLPLP